MNNARLNRSAILALTILSVLGASSASAADCAALTSLKLPDVAISDATAVPRDGAIKVPHCRVKGVIGTEIRFELLLPDQWNRKFVMGGGGGFVGGVDNQVKIVANDGFATVGTDTGHQSSGTTAGWAANNFERQINYGYLGVHRTAEVAKAIIRSHYGTDTTRSYFSGCSNGGRQALMEAQRFPNDFDGIVAGAPAADFTGISAQFVRDAQTLFPNPNELSKSVLSPESLKLVAAKVLAACDAGDGVQDGVLDDPRKCKFDLATLPSCANDTAGSDCVTKTQRDALVKVYGEPRANGVALYAGQPFGGEDEMAGWPLWIAGVNPQFMAVQKAPNLRYAFATEMFRNFVFGDPSWDYSRYDLANLQKDTTRIATYLNATDPDLDRFKARGGKLIIWHGWADAGLTPFGTIKYYEAVQARDPASRDYTRLFMLPGVLHCAGGPGPDTVDWTTAITDWVEKGKAPDQLLATKLAGTEAKRSRPLCPYPQVATYKGKGSTDDAANFACRSPK